MNRTPRLSKSAIEYLDYVWNFESGCTKGCSYCYARDITVRFPAHYPNGFEPTLYPEAFTSPLHLKKASIIGVCFMGDLFDDGIDPEQEHTGVSLRDWIFSTAKLAHRHRFLFLTKQPQNLAKWSPFPDNCWVGVSATDAESFYDATAELSKVEATVKYISFEPLLGEINGGECVEGKRLDLLRDAGINWVIIGAQTKPTVMPKIEWVKEIVEAADKAGIPVFLKDSLYSTIHWAQCYADPVVDVRSLLNEVGKPRQEFPKGV